MAIRVSLPFFSSFFFWWTVNSAADNIGGEKQILYRSALWAYNICILDNSFELQVLISINKLYIWLLIFFNLFFLQYTLLVFYLFISYICSSVGLP